MKTIQLSLTIIFFYTSVNSQQDSKFSLETYFNPLDVSLIDSKRNVNKGNKDVYFFSEPKINQELGFNLWYNLNKKYSTGIGFFYKNYKYNFQSIFNFMDNNINNDDNEASGSKKQNNLEIKTIGFNLSGSYQFQEQFRTKVSISINFGIPISYKFTDSILQNYIYSINDFYYNEEFSPSIMKVQSYIVPEIRFNTFIYKNLSMSYGINSKFIGKNYLYRMSIYHKDTGGKYPIFDYRINTKHISLFMGLSYTFQLPKLRKPKVE